MPQSGKKKNGKNPHYIDKLNVRLEEKQDSGQRSNRTPKSLEEYKSHLLYDAAFDTLHWFQGAIEKTTEGIILVDEQGCILEWNNALEKIFGLKKSKVLGKKIWDVQFSLLPTEQKTEEKLEKLKSKLSLFFESGINSWIGQPREGEYERLDGVRGFIRQIFFPIKTSKGFMLLSFAHDITESKIMEKELRRSEQRYRRLYENLSDGLFMVDEKGVISFCSPNGAEMFGYTEKELIGIHLSNLIHPSDKIRIQEMYEKSIETLRIRTEGIEARGIRKDGRMFYFHATGNPVIEDGRIIGFQSMVRDITERYRTELVVREERDKAQMYLDIAGTMFVALDTQGKITMLNRKGCEILQYEYGEAIGKSWFDQIPENARDEARIAFNQIMQGEIEAIEYTERPIITKNGEERIIAWHTSVLKDDDGQIFGLLSSGTDITQERRAIEALEDSESRYQTLIETTPDAIALADLDAVIMMANKGIYNLTEYESEKDIVGRKVFDFLIPEEHEKARMALKTTLERRGPDPIEFTLLTKSGRRVPADISASIVLDTHENPRAFVIVARDVSQRKKTESELRYTREQALLYLDIMGHDIRNQLQAILGSAEVAKGAINQDSLEKVLGNIADGAAKCEQIISKIKATENLMEAELRPRNLCEIMDDCLVGFSCKYPGIQILIQCDEKDHIIEADDYLELMCNNILENAVQHNPHNEKHIWITVCEENDGFTISIADDGKGVSDTIKKSLFDVTRRFGGVGLHQVGEIVHKYGGRIQIVDRIPGDYKMGAEIRIWLPKSTIKTS